MRPIRALTGRGLHRFHGMIAAGGFARGDRVVVGVWRDSPLGRLVDVMWIDPRGERTLLAPSPAARAYIASLYAFDRTAVTAVRGGWDGEHVDVRAGPLRVVLRPGRRDWRSWVLALRPAPLRRSPAWITLEDRLVEPLGGVLLGGAAGVRLAGTTPGGRREWYGIEDHRELVDGSLTVHGRDAGPLVELRPGLGVGPSDFPSVPALVNVTTSIEPAN